MQRTDRKINAAGENDRRHHQREQADLDGVAHDVRDVVAGEKSAAQRVEEKHFEHEHEAEHGLVAKQHRLAIRH